MGRRREEEPRAFGAVIRAFNSFERWGQRAGEAMSLDIPLPEEVEKTLDKIDNPQKGITGWLDRHGL